MNYGPLLTPILVAIVFSIAGFTVSNARKRPKAYGYRVRITPVVFWLGLFGLVICGLMTYGIFGSSDYVGGFPDSAFIPLGFFVLSLFLILLRFLWYVEVQEDYIIFRCFMIRKKFFIAI